MNQKQPTKKSSFENLTSFLIVAVVVGTAVVLPGLLWIATKLGWQLPGPIQKLAEALGIA